MAGYAGYRVSTSAARTDLWVGLSSFTGGALNLAPSQPASQPIGNLGAGTTMPTYFLLTASAASSTAQSHVVTVYQGKPGTAGAAELCTSTGSFSGVSDTISASANKIADVTGDGVAVSVSTSSPHLGSTVSVTVEGQTGTLGNATGDPYGFYMTPAAYATWPAGAFRLTHTQVLISMDGASAPSTTADVLHLALTNNTDRSYIATYTFTVTGTTASSTSLSPIQEIASGQQIKHTAPSSFSSIPPIPAATNPLTVSLSSSATALTSNGGTVTFTQTLKSTAGETSSVDTLNATLPAGTSYVAGSAEVNGVPTADPAVTGNTLTFAGPFATNSTNPAELSYQVEVPGTPGSYVFTGSGLLAGTTIGATTDTSSPTQASITVTVPAEGAGPQPQTITFPSLADTHLNATPPAPAATADTGLPITYTAGPAEVCSITGTTITLVSIGTCTVTADQPGDADWQPAPSVSQSFEVTAVVVAKPQTITFPALADTVIGTAAPTPNAVATSGLPIAYTAGPAEVCSITGTTITLVGAGTCTVTANQAGDADWQAASSVSQSFQLTAAVLTPPPAPAPPAPPPAPPTVTAKPTSTTGTTPGVVNLAGLPPGATVSVAPDLAAQVEGVSGVTIEGSQVKVVATPTYSGVLSIPVTVVLPDGSTTTTTVRVTVNPNPATAAGASLAGPNSTTVRWAPAGNATGYEVSVNGQVVCRTAIATCVVPQLLGPAARVTVMALGNDATRSATTPAPYQASSFLTIGRVYFATDSATLTSADKVTLQGVVRVMRSQGFSQLVLVGNTDSRGSHAYNVKLSKRRADAVHAYLHAALGTAAVRYKVTYVAYDIPAASNATAAGRALNRRTDITLR
ncbi:MAG TPA: OmpA family protein [Acidothermaceae bacterium]